VSMIRTVYSVKLRNQLEELRPAFRELGQGFEQLTRKRAEIAPLFMRVYHTWRRETKRPFIAFVHELDPSMPVNDRKAYREHRSYRAAGYMLQLAEQPEQAAKPPRGLTPLAMLAVAIKSFLPLCGSVKDQKLVLEALMKTSRWGERDIHKVTIKIRNAKPISLPNLPRLVKAVQSTKAVVRAFEQERRIS
jgi:hypothetical protein